MAAAGNLHAGGGAQAQHMEALETERDDLDRELHSATERIKALEQQLRLAKQVARRG